MHVAENLEGEPGEIIGKLPEFATFREMAKDQFVTPPEQTNLTQVDSANNYNEYFTLIQSELLKKYLLPLYGTHYFSTLRICWCDYHGHERRCQWITNCYHNSSCCPWSFHFCKLSRIPYSL